MKFLGLIKWIRSAKSVRKTRKSSYNSPKMSKYSYITKLPDLQQGFYPVPSKIKIKLKKPSCLRTLCSTWCTCSESLGWLWVWCASGSPRSLSSWCYASVKTRKKGCNYTITLLLHNKRKLVWFTASSHLFSRYIPHLIWSQLWKNKHFYMKVVLFYL